MLDAFATNPFKALADGNMLQVVTLSLLLGGTRRQLIVRSAWVGGLFLLLIDSAARSVVYPVDLPAGLLAAFTGPPFFIWLLWQRHRREAHGQA